MISCKWGRVKCPSCCMTYDIACPNDETLQLELKRCKFCKTTLQELDVEARKQSSMTARPLPYFSTAVLDPNLKGSKRSLKRKAQEAAKAAWGMKPGNEGDDNGGNDRP